MAQPHSKTIVKICAWFTGVFLLSAEFVSGQSNTLGSFEDSICQDNDHAIFHACALEAVLERWDLPCWGHRRTGELLKRNFERELADNDTIELGDSPDGRAGWQLRCLFTPGHAEGHQAFYDCLLYTSDAADE